ncbi:MAG: hypothetical protein SAK29_13685 [Scytonema sp. PMC 1069.18]|nr:hypothetical protein [Scytonema sp. PMC 1069.18]MEC4881021.1 hypothetical protein [Scytonema sp. PMC 1070.18]
MTHTIKLQKSVSQVNNGFCKWTLTAIKEKSSVRQSAEMTKETISLATIYMSAGRGVTCSNFIQPFSRSSATRKPKVWIEIISRLKTPKAIAKSVSKPVHLTTSLNL